MFDLELLGQPEGEGERLFSWGRIRLGEFRDEFQVPLYDWAPGDYVAQWLDAAERLVAGAPAVVFLTHMVHPTAAYHMGWPAWRDGDRVLVQERLFLAEQLGGPFDLERPETAPRAPPGGVGRGAPDLAVDGDPPRRRRVRGAETPVERSRLAPAAPANPQASHRPPMLDLKLDLLQTLSLAAVLYFVGLQLRKRIGWLDRLNIPAAVVGGLIFALLVLAGPGPVPQRAARHRGAAGAERRLLQHHRDGRKPRAAAGRRTPGRDLPRSSPRSSASCRTSSGSPSPAGSASTRCSG